MTSAPTYVVLGRSVVHRADISSSFVPDTAYSACGLVRGPTFTRDVFAGVPLCGRCFKAEYRRAKHEGKRAVA